jgi:hypothetical protein
MILLSPLPFPNTATSLPSWRPRRRSRRKALHLHGRLAVRKCSINRHGVEVEVIRPVMCAPQQSAALPTVTLAFEAAMGSRTSC